MPMKTNSNNSAKLLCLAALFTSMLSSCVFVEAEKQAVQKQADVLKQTKAQKQNVQAERPNILFIMADDLNDYIGVMNSEIGTKTPNIDKLAQSGTLFTNAHSNAPVCSPSRASLFSGILPHDSGYFAFKNWRKNKVLANSKTIMEQLRDNGYQTAGVGKLMHHPWKGAWHEYGLRQDYTPIAFNGNKPVGHPSVPEPYRTKIGPLDATYSRLSDVPSIAADKKNPGFEGWYYNGFKKPFKYVNEQDRDKLPDEMYADWAVAKLNQWQEESMNKPFFMGVGFIRPHTPLVVPDRFFEMFPIDKINLPELIAEDDKDTFFEKIYMPKVSKGRKHYDTLMASYFDKQQALKTYYQAYLASVAFMDEQVGKVLDALNNSRFKNNTIVVFTSDHGYSLGEKNYLFKNNLWERSTRIPLIIYDGRDPEKQQVNEAVSLVDLYPTFTELASVQSDNRKNDQGKKLSGKSLVPLLNNVIEDQERMALTVVQNYEKPQNINFAVRTKHWRYISYFSGKEELYDHRNDPNEVTNLADEKNVKAIKAKLANKLASLVSQ